MIQLPVGLPSSGLFGANNLQTMVASSFATAANEIVADPNFLAVSAQKNLYQDANGGVTKTDSYRMMGADQKPGTWVSDNPRDFEPLVIDRTPPFEMSIILRPAAFLEGCLVTAKGLKTFLTGIDLSLEGLRTLLNRRASGFGRQSEPRTLLEALDFPPIAEIAERAIFAIDPRKFLGKPLTRDVARLLTIMDNLSASRAWLLFAKMSSEDLVTVANAGRTQAIFELIFRMRKGEAGAADAVRSIDPTALAKDIRTLSEVKGERVFGWQFKTTRENYIAAMRSDLIDLARYNKKAAEILGTVSGIDRQRVATVN